MKRRNIRQEKKEPGNVRETKESHWEKRTEGKEILTRTEEVTEETEEEE